MPPELFASFLACAFSCFASSSGIGMLLSAVVGGEDADAAAAGLSFFLVFFSCFEVGVTFEVHMLIFIVYSTLN